MALIASCHCGKIQVGLPHSPKDATDCNCTYCSRVGAIWGYFNTGELSFISTEGASAYSASEGLNVHHSCGTCGIEVWADTPDYTKMYDEEEGQLATAEEASRRHAVNLRTVGDLDWSMILVEKVDGRSGW